MFLESFHNQLKTVYFEGKRNRRIDILLDTLLQIENNVYFKHLAAQKFSLPSEENIKTSDRHQGSYDISNSSVFQVNENTFSIVSKDKLYTVNVDKQKCNETHCYTKCQKVPCIDLCRHLLSCNCFDYGEGNICKHLHKIQSMLNINMNRQGLKEKGDIEIKNTENKTRNSSKEKSHIPNKIRGIQDRLNKIMSQVTNSQNVQEHRLDNIISSLDHIISANDAFENLPSSLKEFKKTDKISSNAKNELQPRFKSTNQKPGRKIKKNSKKAISARKKSIAPFSKPTSSTVRYS